MTTDPTVEQDEQDEPTIEAEQRGGLIERLRRRREEIGSGEVTVDMDVPGYDGDLFVRYGMIEGGYDVVRRLAKRVEKSKNPRAELNGAADLLAHACRGIYVRQRDGSVEPLDDPQAEEAPIFADVDRVALTLGFASRDHRQNPITTRMCVFRVFNNDLAVQAQYVELSRWLQEVTKDDDEEFVGESKGSTRS